MYSKTIYTIIFIVLMGVSWSCISFKYATPYQKFYHETHESIIVEQKADCFSCHNVTEIAIRGEKDPMKQLEMLKATLKASDDKRFISGKCHECHKDIATREAKAPTNCATCHVTLADIKPANHAGLWKSEHTADARGVTANCADCHSQRFCVDCHTSRDTMKMDMHPRTFKIAHVTAATADPASCSSCHVARFCSDCHTRSR